MTTYRDVPIGDLFRPTNGKAVFVRDYIDGHPGPHPVYSASLTEPFGLVDTYDYDGPFLTWVMNGYGGRMQEVNGKFSANRDRGVLVPVPGTRTPSLTYLRFVLEPLFIERAVGRRVDGLRNEYTKLYPPTVADILIPLPVDDTGQLDYEAMERIGERLARLEKVKANTAALATDIADAELAFIVPQPSTDISMGDDARFKLSIGKRLLRKEIGSPGDEGVPVYSANVRIPFGTVPHAGELTFEHPSLIWGIDGIFDWNLIPAGVQFVPTDHCGRAEILDENLDPEYVLYALRATRGQYGFDRVFRANLNNVKDLIGVTIPTASDGLPNYDIQRRLADEHKKLLRLKSSSLEAIGEVIHTQLGLQIAGQI